LTEVQIQPPPSAGASSGRRVSRPAILIGLLGIVFFLVGGAGGSYQGKLASVEKNDNSSFLPASAQSTKVDDLAQIFQPVQTVPGFLVFSRPGGLTGADRQFIAHLDVSLRRVPGVDSTQVGPPLYASDGSVAAISVPLVGKQSGRSVSGETLAKVEKSVLELARTGAPGGLVVHSAGPAGLLTALIDSFSGIDGTLLLVAGAVVVVILLLVYRSPVLWFFPLFSALLALGVSALVVYQLAKHGLITLNGQSQGILSVLVLGAGTDYALLLTSRYREELHNYQSRLAAMTHAWRRAAPAIFASASTVMLALLCLLLGALNSDKSLGPVCAIGIAATAGVMLSFLPLALTVVPRGVFWPRVPLADGSGDPTATGFWRRFADRLAAHDRQAWVSTFLVLLVLAGAVTTLKAGGLSAQDSFTNNPDPVVGQRIFDAHFPQGAGAPAEVVTPVGEAPQVIRVLSALPGVAKAPGSVCIAVDYSKLARLEASSPGLLAGGQARSGCPPPELQVAPYRGLTLIDANLDYAFDSPAALKTVATMRSALAKFPHTLVGGSAAVNYDTQQASRHDRNLIIPVILVVILVVLGLLLRAVLAPVLLVASVVLSFTATLGVSALVFNHVFHFANADPAFPLFAFVFLVALGVDYNIFLMTRVREETLRLGTRPGVLRGLAATGGVITSAGLVLAATFAVLGVLPLVFLAEVGFSVAFGVLLDTLVVRSVVVPALVHDLGSVVWWPSRLWRARA